MNAITSRYLNKEVLTAMLAFTFVLLVIIVTGRVTRYLGEIAQGTINPDLLFWLIWYRLPEFLQLILPLGLFLGILLGFGRMYVDNEMTVLSACGVSPLQIVIKLLAGVLLVTVVVGVLSLWVTPRSDSKMEILWNLQNNDAMKFESLVPGRFQLQARNTRTIYTENLSADKRQLGNVFIAQKSKSRQKESSSVHTAKSDQTLMILVAESATQQIKPETGERFLILNDGYRYDGRPGSLDYRVMQFSSYGVKVADEQTNTQNSKQSAKPTRDLWGSAEAKDNAELQWRLSLPLLVPIVALLAIPLSRVKPRKGRFVKLLPAFCVYLLYILLLIGMRSELMKSHTIPVAVGMWWVHLFFFLLAIVLFKQEQLVQYWRHLRPPLWRDN